jgi:hypothetical protein
MDLWGVKHMFKGLMSAFQTQKDLWAFAGYWADVIAEYGKLTDWNLEKTSIRWRGWS